MCHKNSACPAFATMLVLFYVFTSLLTVAVVSAVSKNAAEPPITFAFSPGAKASAGSTQNHLTAEPAKEQGPTSLAGTQSLSNLEKAQSLLKDVVRAAGEEANVLEPKKEAGDVEIHEDEDHPALMDTFSGLLRERRGIKKLMFFHIFSSFLVGILTYFLRSNPILMLVFGNLDDTNENWGQNIEDRWVNHQEKLADFLLLMMEKNHIDPKSVKGKRIHLEYSNNRFGVVPVYRTFPGEPLPEQAREINNNRVNLWKNLFQ